MDVDKINSTVRSAARTTKPRKRVDADASDDMDFGTQKPARTPIKKSSKKSSPKKSLVDVDTFEMRIGAIDASMQNCEGGKCLSHIREFNSQLQKVNDKLDKEYTTGALTADDWKRAKSKTRKLQKKSDEVVCRSVDAFGKCIVGKKKR